MTDTHEIGLVGCVATKRDKPSIPKELYTSDYFSKMRAYAEQFHDDWWILSAKHGLLYPDGSPVPPYDETLSSATVGEKRDWAQEVYDQLQQEGLLDGEVKFVIHAGQDYHGELVPLLENHQNVTVEIPTEGLRIGKTKAWYKARLSD